MVSSFLYYFFHFLEVIFKGYLSTKLSDSDMSKYVCILPFHLPISQQGIHSQVENHFAPECECGILLSSNTQDCRWEVWLVSFSSNVSNLVVFIFFFLSLFKVFFLSMEFWNFTRMYVGMGLCFLSNYIWLILVFDSRKLYSWTWISWIYPPCFNFSHIFSSFLFYISTF